MAHPEPPAASAATPSSNTAAANNAAPHTAPHPAANDGRPAEMRPPIVTVVLVRHGRSTANTAGILAGRTPGVNLDDYGRDQAASISDRLAGTRDNGTIRGSSTRWGRPDPEGETCDRRSRERCFQVRMAAWLC